MPTPTLSIPALTPDQQVRFWSKVNKNGQIMPNMETACWLWTAYKDRDGYGMLQVCRRPHGAHRLSYAVSGGVLTEGKPQVLHRCDNPSCVNPSHLFAGSNQDNMTDKTKKGRNNAPRGDSHGSKTMPERFQRGEKHYGSKITDQQVAYIRSSTNTQAELARELGVTQPHISMIRSGKKRRSIHLST